MLKVNRVLTTKLIVLSLPNSQMEGKFEKLSQEQRNQLLSYVADKEHPSSGR